MKKRKKIIAVILVVIVIAFVILRAVSCSAAAAQGAFVTTTNAIRGDLQESISTTGTVKSEEVKVIFAPVSGTLQQVPVAAGDAVEAGQLLAGYDTGRLENNMRQSQLQLEKSNAAYDSAMSDNAKNQSKLTEANTNLDVLNQQIQDTKAYIRELQNELNESQRNTANALAKENMDLTNSASQLQREIETLKETLAALKSAEQQDEQAIASANEEITQKEQELQEVNSSMNHNSYVSSTASNSDYVAELQEKISVAQEQLQDYESYKAEMQSQKSSTENSVMDSYDKTQYSADKEMASLTYQETEEDYNQAKEGIVADFTGIITECSAVEGSTVAGGTALMTLASSENVKVSFNASKYDIQKLELGQKADVTISGRVYEGEISKINRMASENSSNTPMVGVEVHLLNPDDNIILGIDAKLVVYTKKAENALLIPVEAINADKEGDFLYVAENGVAVRKPIVCGVSTDTYTEVTEGITEEDLVIVSSYTTLEEGMAVTAVEME